MYFSAPNTHSIHDVICRGNSSDFIEQSTKSVDCSSNGLSIRDLYIYKDYCIMNNHYIWESYGVVYNIFECTNNFNKLPVGDLTDEAFYMKSVTIEKNSNEYLNDALLLQEQFFNTILFDKKKINAKSAFYTAQSYFNCFKYKESYEWYCLYTQLKNTNNDELFECYKKIVTCMIILDFPVFDIICYAKKGIQLCVDRAEIYYIMSSYFYKFHNYELAFFNLKKASECTLSYVLQHHSLFIDEICYGEHLDEILIYLAIKSNRNEYAIELLESIPDEKRKNEIRKNVSL
jgi:hypothetical protein